MAFRTPAIVASLLLLTIHFVSSSALAKGSFTKIVVMGSENQEPIEIVDEASLEFLDMRGMMLIPDAIPKPSKLAAGYELTRYGGGEYGDYQPFDRLHYYPGPTGAIGHVFYDGLVGGASEFDGKWFQANVCGERMLSRYINSESREAEAYETASSDTQPWSTLLVALASSSLGVVIGATVTRRKWQAA